MDGFGGRRWWWAVVAVAVGGVGGLVEALNEKFLRADRGADSV